LQTLSSVAQAVTISGETVGFSETVHFSGLAQESSLTGQGLTGSTDLTPELPANIITHQALITTGAWDSSSFPSETKTFMRFKPVWCKNRILAFKLLPDSRN
jgi:hypothetical protein